MLYKIVNFFDTYILVWHVNILTFNESVDIVFLTKFLFIIYGIFLDFLV